MASQNEPKTETARVDLGNRRPSIKPREAGRIQLPLSESLDKEPLHTPTEPQSNGGSGVEDVTSTEFFEPSEPTSVSMPLSASVKPTPDSTSSQDPSIAAAPAEKNSMLLTWILLGASVLILIIQIWTYFS